MKRLVRSTLSASLSLLLAGTLVGCGGGDKSGSTTPAAAEAPAEPPPEAAPAEPGATEPSAAGADLAPQLAQGEKVWADSCSVCHGDGGEGKGKKNPAVVGRGALNEFKNGAELLTYVKEKMPKDDPGTLSEADYVAVTAWMLQKNGKLGAGAQALTPESAASIALP